MQNLTRFLASLFFVAATASVQATPFSQLVVFGDSNSDTGNVAAITSGFRPPAATYWNGRYSNGPVAVEYMASALGISIDNYAQGGATTGTSNGSFPNGVPAWWTPAIDPSKLYGVQTQVTNYLGNHVIDPNALFFLWAGSNDFANAVPAQFAAISLIAANNIANELTLLHNAGGQNFFVAGLAYDKHIAGSRNEIYNTALLAAINALAFDVTYFDTADVYTQMINDGMNNSAPCLQSTEGFVFPGQIKQATLLPSGYTMCSNPAQYIRWDPNGHLTTAAQSIVGAHFASALSVPEPATLLLMGSGLAMMWLRRSK